MSGQAIATATNTSVCKVRSRGVISSWVPRFRLAGEVRKHYEIACRLKKEHISGIISQLTSGCLFTQRLPKDYWARVHFWNMDFSATLPEPYFACHAKKYRSAASGWPTRQNVTQNVRLPIVFAVSLLALISGSVSRMSGTCHIMPAKATPTEVSWTCS